MGYKNELTIPNEPTDIKKMAQVEKLGVEWNIDSLIAWVGNSLPKYLWTTCNWGIVLKKRGYTWQNFLKILSLHRRDIILWLRDEMTWKDLIKSVNESIEGPIGRLVKGHF